MDCKRSLSRHPILWSSLCMSTRQTLFCAWARKYIITANESIQGSLSDRFGKKIFMVGGCALGIAGSLISATAHSVQRIIGGNILSGVATAGCIISIAANQEITPNKIRPYVMGFNQAVASLMALMGTFSAAAFVKNNTGGAGGWRWAYYLNAIVFGITGLGIAATYFPPPTKMRRENYVKSLVASVDYVGILLLAGSLASLIIGLTWGGSTYPWSSGHVVAPLTVGCVGLLSFGIYEWKFCDNGLFDHRLLQTMNFPILLFVCTIDGMLLLGVNVLYAQEIADLFTTDAVRIAVILCPYLITSTLGCIPAGWIMGKTKSYRTLLVASLIWASLFTGLMALINKDRLSMAYAFSALFGIGTAVTTVIPIVALTLSVPSFLLGTAGTLSISCRALGGIIGITIFTAIFNNRLASLATPSISKVLIESGAPVPLPAVLGALSVGDPHALLPLGLPEVVNEALLGTYAVARQNSWTYVWVAVSTLVFVNAIFCCFLKPVRDNMNAHVESALEESEVRREQMVGLSAKLGTN